MLDLFPTRSSYGRLLWDALWDDFKLWRDMLLGSGISVAALALEKIFKLIPTADWEQHWVAWILSAVLPFGACLALDVVWRFITAPLKVQKTQELCYQRELAKLQEKVDELAAYKNGIEMAKPRIRLQQPNAIFVKQVSQNYGNVQFTGVPFINVRFVNDPVGPYPSAIAPDVRAKIDYYRLPENTHVLSLDGRWADTDQPSAISPLQSKTHLLQIAFGIGEAHDLDIAYRDGQTHECFAWNNDNYGYHLFRKPEHRLEGCEFRVNVRLLGTWVDEQFAFKFRPEGDGFAVS